MFEMALINIPTMWAIYRISERNNILMSSWISYKEKFTGQLIEKNMPLGIKKPGTEEKTSF